MLAEFGVGRQGKANPVTAYKSFSPNWGLIGLLSYYAVSLILVPLVKGWIPGPVGTAVSCALQMLYVSFLFPWFLRRLEKAAD